MRVAKLYTKVNISLTIDETIDAQSFNDSELFRAWIYDQVMLGNSDWDSVEIVETKIHIEDQKL